MASGLNLLRVRNWSLRRKLVAVFIAASLVPFTLAVVIELELLQTERRAEAARVLVDHADLLRAQIDALHHGYLTAADKLAHLAPVTALVRGTADPAAISRVRQVIEVKVDSDHDLTGIAIVDRTGRVLASRPDRTGEQLSARAYARAAPWVSDLYIDLALDHPATPSAGGVIGAPTIAYAAPIDGLGYVVLWVSSDALWDLVRGAGHLAGEDSTAVVFDRDGIRIAHSSSDAILYHPVAPLAPARRAALIAQQRFADRTAHLIDDVQAFPIIGQQITASDPDPTMFTAIAAVGHAWSYGVSRRLVNAPWTVAYLLPMRTLETQLVQLTGHKLVVAGFILVAVFALGLWLAWLLLRPVELLSASRDELEDRVADRTGELVRAAVTEAQSRQALEAGARRLEILSRTGHELAAVSGDAERVLELAARRLGEAIGDACTIRRLDDTAAFLEPTQVLHHPDPDPVIRARVLAALGASRIPIGTGIAGKVAKTGEALRIPDVTAAALASVVPAALQALLAGVGVVSLLAVPLRSRDRTTGVVILVRVTGSAAFTVDDERFAQDVADRAGLALDNAELVETLERRVAARTAALETANKELEAFSYSVSHDLRGPLRTIDGFSEILLSDYTGQLEPDAQRYLSRIRVATQRMAGLIDDLLDLARLTRVQLRWQPIDVSAIAGQIAAELARSSPARTTPIHVAPGLAAQGDARLVTIALENLLGNAWKFTGKHPAAEIWLEVRRDDHGRAVFSVRDTGAGFDMKYVDKLFLPFQRLHTADEFEGEGVGLATVQRIIRRHGGRIWAEAEVGVGATFLFYLGEPS